MNLEDYVGVSIKLFEANPVVDVVSIGIVTEIRSDGSYMVTMPMAHILIDASGKPVENWEKTKQSIHVSALVAVPYNIDKALMPPPMKKKKEKSG